MRRRASDILESVRETAGALHESGVMSDTTRADLDGLCADSASGYDAARLRALRERLAVSRATLADYLGVSPSTIGQWERGDAIPGGPARKLLDLIERKGLDALA
jgi:putative transcriptional regulator